MSQTDFITQNDRRKKTKPGKSREGETKTVLAPCEKRVRRVSLNGHKKKCHVCINIAQRYV